MRNPYEILEVPQDATNAQILKAMTVAMRKRKYSNNDIAHARSQLSKPVTRLAADFTFPVFEAVFELDYLKATKTLSDFDMSALNPAKYDSL